MIVTELIFTAVMLSRQLLLTEFHENSPSLCVDIRSHGRKDARVFRLKHLLLHKEYLRTQQNVTAVEHLWNIFHVLIDFCKLSCYEVGSVSWPFVLLARVIYFLADTAGCGLLEIPFIPITIVCR